MNEVHAKDGVRAAPATAAAGGSPGWMAVRVGHMELALPIERVGEVVPTPDLARVPMAPPAVAGVTSVRGTIIPVVDLGLRVRGRAADRAGRMVVLTSADSDERIGLLVDGVAGLVDRSSPTAARAGDAAGDVDARFIASAVRPSSGRTIAVLDLDVVLDIGSAGERVA